MIGGSVGKILGAVGPSSITFEKNFSGIRNPGFQNSDFSRILNPSSQNPGFFFAKKGDLEFPVQD